jgi:hypothetical protein
MITVSSILGTQIQANIYEAGSLKLTSMTPETAKAILTNSEGAEVPVALPPGVFKHLSLADAPEDPLIEIGLLKGGTESLERQTTPGPGRKGDSHQGNASRE